MSAGTAETPTHAAAVYDSAEDLCARVLPYLNRGLASGDTVVVNASPEVAAVLEARLNSSAATVRWGIPGVDHSRLGATLDGVRAFLTTQRAAGRQTRVLAESVIDGDPGRAAAYLRNEAVSTDLFAGFGVPIACLYDRRRCSADLLHDVHRTHPQLLDTGGDPVASADHVAPADYLAAHPGPLSRVPDRPSLDIAPSAPAELSEVRHRVRACAVALGLSEPGCQDLELAVGEVVANAFEHGRPPYRVRAWGDGAVVAVRVDDGGPGGGLATAGFRRPDPAGFSAAGMWLARHLADVLHVATSAEGTGVELRFPTT